MADQIRIALILAALAACNFDHAASGSPVDAAKVLAECRKVCPANSTPMALSTIVSDTIYSTHWSCGCLANREGK